MRWPETSWYASANVARRSSERLHTRARETWGIAVTKASNWVTACPPAPMMATVALSGLANCEVANPVAAGVKELWRQSRGRAVRAANPRYTVALASAEGGTPARLRVVYADGRKADVPAQGLSLPDLIDALLEPTEAMRDKEDAVEMEKN